jgi:hypothetical protein
VADTGLQPNASGSANRANAETTIRTNSGANLPLLSNDQIRRVHSPEHGNFHSTGHRFHAGWGRRNRLR